MKKFCLSMFATLAVCSAMLLLTEAASNAFATVSLSTLAGDCKTTITGCKTGTCTLANKCPAPNGECFCQ
jgi:hypothetical protein